MPRKKRARYGDYCQIINGDFYGVINVPVGNGQYRKRKKKVSSRIEARQWAMETLDRLRHGGTSKGELQTFIDLAAWYKEYFLVEPAYERGHKIEGTKDWLKSRAKLDRMCAHFGPVRLASFSEKDLIAYSRSRRKEVTQTTINRDLALLRAMFKKGHEADRNIVVPKFPINTSAEHERDRVMTKDEEQRILAACVDVEMIEYKRNGKTIKAEHEARRDHLRPIVILAADTAMRAGEITGILWSDVSLETGTINIRKEISKTGKARKVGMTPRVKQELAAIEPKKGRVFPYGSVWKSFTTACKRAGVKGLRFHDLRHTATTRMIRAGIPHTEVMKITGHTQIKTFLRYLNLTETTVQTTAEQLARYLDGR
jgi:integrase